MRHEDPVLASFFHAVDHDYVTGTYAVPARASHHVTVTSNDGTWFHASFLLGGSVVTRRHSRVLRWNHDLHAGTASLALAFTAV
ncbi:MAG TPA: hypothetical protein VMU68_14950 [Acidimicrobiales bacterium]|nr:hypothetical protein [Acidimicrobiales bacterium]